MKKIANFNISFIYYAFTFLFTSLVFLLFLIDRNLVYFKSQNDILANIIWLIPIIILSYISIKFINQNQMIMFSFRNLMIAQFILFLFQLFIAYNIYFYTGWNASTIRNTAFLMVEHPEQIA